MLDFDIPTYITRPIYVSRLQPLVEKDVIKVLVGQRRVGKSYLLYHVVDMIKERDPVVSHPVRQQGAGRVRRRPNPRSTSSLSPRESSARLAAAAS